MNARITHHDLIDVTALTPVVVNHTKVLVNPTTIISDPDAIEWAKSLILAYDPHDRVWRTSDGLRSWDTLTLCELNDDYYECADCGRVCDNELDPATVILRDRPLCGSCWGAKVDGWNDVAAGEL